MQLDGEEEARMATSGKLCGLIRCSTSVMFYPLVVNYVHQLLLVSVCCHILERNRGNKLFETNLKTNAKLILVRTSSRIITSVQCRFVDFS
jgi:hypothetical protein